MMEEPESFASAREVLTMQKDLAAERPPEPDFHWPVLRDIGLGAPLRWVKRGFHDMLAAPAASLFYGCVLATMGFPLTRFYAGAVGLALTTDFLLIGPFLRLACTTFHASSNTTRVRVWLLPLVSGVKTCPRLVFTR